MGKSYAHFFSKEIAEKVFKSIKSNPSQYQDCEFKILAKNNDEDYFKKIYLYLRNNDYLNYVSEQRDDNFVFDKKPKIKIEETKENKDKNEVSDNNEIKENILKIEKIGEDDDGFKIVNKKKK